MTVPKWNDDAWARAHGIQDKPARKIDKTKLGILAAAALLVVAGVATAGSQPWADDKVLICHQTPDGVVPLIVDRNGYEHGHHRHHEEDYFLEPDQQCVGDDAAILPEEALPEPALPENVTLEAPGNDTALDAPAPVDNTTVADDNQTEEVEEVPTFADLKVQQVAIQQGDHVRLEVRIENIGDAAAANVSLHDALPQVGRDWYVSATDCTLQDNALDCWFPDMAAGAVVTIVMEAYTDQMRCGDALTNTVHVSADNDAETRNDAASASIAAKAC